MAMNAIGGAAIETQTLLARLRAFCFPCGEEPARLIRTVKTTETGQMRMAPGARWIPFTAEQEIDSRYSSFSWVARLDPGKITSATVTDAYEQGRGRLIVKVGGLIPVRRISGPEIDRGELQRYLASIVFCPPILLNHPTLEYSVVGPLTLRIRDTRDISGASVDLDISEEGRPLICRADRPRMVGKQALMTPWSATGGEFRIWEGLRVPKRLEVTWHLPEGTFSYYRGEITLFHTIH